MSFVEDIEGGICCIGALWWWLLFASIKELSHGIDETLAGILSVVGVIVGFIVLHYWEDAYCDYNGFKIFALIVLFVTILGYFVNLCLDSGGFILAVILPTITSFIIFGGISMLIWDELEYDVPDYAITTIIGIICAIVWAIAFGWQQVVSVLKSVPVLIIITAIVVTASVCYKIWKGAYSDLAKAYPWIGVIIGAIIGGILTGVFLMDIPPDNNFLILNTIVFGIIIGCFYGWLIEKSKRAPIIGGILGFLFGLHPVPLFVFIVFGLCGVIASTISDEDTQFLGMYITCAIVSIIVGIFRICDGNNDGWALIIFGLCPFPWINIFTAFIASITFGLYFLPDLLIPLLFPILLFPLIGYVIGDVISEKAFEEESRFGGGLEIYGHTPSTGGYSSVSIGNINDVPEHAVCPYCQENIRESFYNFGGVVKCPKCGTFHHTDCFRQGGCGNPACRFRKS